MKKALSLILVAVLMSVLCIPASAAMTEQNVAINKSYTTAGIYADQSGNIPYPDEEGKTLTDGQYASGGYSDALWVGFNIGAPDIASADPKVGSVVVDLGESFDITGISGHFSAGAADAGIAPPSKVTFYASNNGTEWTLIGEGVKEEIADGDLTLNIGIDDFILLVANEGDIVSGHIRSESVKAFRAPKGTVVEVYATTLHYAPCHTDGSKGFKVVIVLPKGTNTEKPGIGEPRNMEEKLLWARNKWLIAHEDTDEARCGAFVGIDGENIDIASML